MAELNSAFKQETNYDREINFRLFGKSLYVLGHQLDKQLSPFLHVPLFPHLLKKTEKKDNHSSTRTREYCRCVSASKNVSIKPQKTNGRK